MVDKKYIEVIWFVSQTSYHWVSIPLGDKPTTVEDLLTLLPWTVDLEQHVIGIWGKRVKLNQVVVFGDRIELYKPLQLTPNEIRLRRKNQTD